MRLPAIITSKGLMVSRANASSPLLAVSTSQSAPCREAAVTSVVSTASSWSASRIRFRGGGMPPHRLSAAQALALKWPDLQLTQETDHQHYAHFLGVNPRLEAPID